MAYNVHTKLDIESTGDITNTFLDLIQELRVAFKEAASSAIPKFKETLSGLHDVARTLIETASSKLIEIRCLSLDEITALKEKAQNRGVDIHGSLRDEEEKIKQLHIELAGEVLTCVTDKINEAQKIASETMADFKNGPEIISCLEAEFRACNSSYGMNKVVYNAGIQLAKIPMDISLKFAEATKQVATIQYDLASSTNSKVDEMTKATNEIIIDVTKCVNSKISVQS